ncbi:MAG: thrombospondin type 3 repeat-containing protein, partial [Thermoanaerobaculia bacterium]
MHNPEPPSVVIGRRFLYDAKLSSSNGEASCGSCHVFGDFDSLAWDLGNPDGEVIDDPGPFISELLNLITGQPMEPVFHPMKGPMTTQSLRGMASHGPMHWRGDRTGGNDEPSKQPDSGTFDERAAFDKFNEAFPSLLGRHATRAQEEMDAFTDFVLRITYPPNPNRRLDNALTPDQEAGRRLFDSVNCGIPSAPELKGAVLACSGCHKLDPNANPGTAAPGFFGTAGFSSFAFNPQLFKVPHLRNIYQKVGMFGNPENPGFVSTDTSFQGDQVRGFGLLHDGAVDTVFRFMHGLSFSEQFNGPGQGFPDGPEGERRRRQVEAFILAFPTNLAPAVGQQVTLRSSHSAAVDARIDLLRQRAEAGECELVAKSGEAGFLYVGSGLFAPDRRGQPPITDAALRSLAPVTYTCVPPGSGVRIGVDRDGDGAWDGDERQANTDPADPASGP